jgi:hypothetical protein
MAAKVYWTPYQPEHYLAFPLRGEEAAVAERLGVSLAKIATDNAQSSADTWWINDEVVACSGIWLVGDRLGEVWFRCGDGLHAEWRALARAMRPRFEAHCAALRLMRIQAAIQSEFAAAHRFIQFFGLRPEGPIKLSGEDMILYARHFSS